jgi:hypothetical protein
MGNFQRLPSILILTLSILSFDRAHVVATVAGSGEISVENYPQIGASAPFNPPWCEMPWSELNLNRITAVQQMTKSECGKCLQVCGSSGCQYVMAVDKGGDGLDLSTGCSINVIGNNNGRGYATWHDVSSSYCNGIWSKKN